MTLRFAVVGSPVAHSKSPALHAAGYRALGLPHVYEKLETTEEELESRVSALRRGELAGINVTVPHKKRVLSFVDEVAPSARAIGAANTLTRTTGGTITAHNTDAKALEEELVRLVGAEGAGAFAGRHAVVLGSGGAARAAIFALGQLGVSYVEVRARAGADREAAQRLATELGTVLTAAAVTARSAVQPWVGGPSSAVRLGVGPLAAPLAEDPELAVVIQTTSCGMVGAADGDIVANAVAWESAPASCVALDVVYAPRNTPFLGRARARGLAAADGLGMLAEQGALAFELWLGQGAPREAMLAAVAC